ncbi:MAG: glycosyltransferase family protein [Zoogloeaceae bacterium]|nr:glycosyltransferase family protein [Zoogloeaceae bacterium]
MSSPFFSVVICSIDAWKFAQASTRYDTLLADFPHEIIGIHDAQSLAEGYNRGLARAQGDLLVFSHDDILILDSAFADKLASRMQHYDLLGFAGTTRCVYPFWIAAGWPHLRGAVAHLVRDFPQRLCFNLYGAPEWPVADGIEAVDGLCMIVRREAAEAVGFDAHTFDGWHLYDLDFSFALFRAGYRLGVCCDIPLIHASSGNFDAAYTRYAERFSQKYAPCMQPGLTPKRSPEAAPAHFSGTKALLAHWNETTLRRADLALQRRLTRRPSAPQPKAAA